MSPVANEDAARDDEQDADAILAALEDENDTSYRDQRLQELKQEAQTFKSSATATHKIYSRLAGDDDALRFTTEHERAVVHFFHPDFARCSIMDAHIESIATKHNEQGDADVALGKVDVNHAPFVVEKLGIRVLPCVIGFVKGVAKGKVTGFEGICWDGREDRPIVARALEERFVEWEVLGRKLLEGDDSSEDDDGKAEKTGSHRRGISGRKQEVEDEDDDWD